MKRCWTASRKSSSSAMLHTKRRVLEIRGYSLRCVPQRRNSLSPSDMRSGCTTERHRVMNASCLRGYTTRCLSASNSTFRSTEPAGEMQESTHRPCHSLLYVFSSFFRPPNNRVQNPTLGAGSRRVTSSSCFWRFSLSCLSSDVCPHLMFPGS